MGVIEDVNFDYIDNPSQRFSAGCHKLFLPKFLITPGTLNYKILAYLLENKFQINHLFW